MSDLFAWLRQMNERETPEHLTTDEWNLLREITVGGEAVADRQGAPRMGEVVEVRVNGCAYACCSRGWQRRDGYEQVYRGYIDNLTDRTFMLYSLGVGTISYVVAARFDELLDVGPACSSWPAARAQGSRW